MAGMESKKGRRLFRKSWSCPADAEKEASTRSGEFESMSEGLTVDEEEEDFVQTNRSPMPRFPQGAKLGSHSNCWSETPSSDFQVRGHKYLSNRKKVPSGPYVFPVRGVDLFLTDSCPKNAASNARLFGGALREKPTFVINFRLPWGVLLYYFEIPEKFIPYIQARYEEGFDKSTMPSLDALESNGERCVARFLQADDATKNATLKIVPVVVQGPWVVRNVAGGKPAIIGTKLPVVWHYQKAQGNQQMYLEADLDIVSSSAARGILSVAKAHTRSLTLDLGFVVQGNQCDELPEQMLVGVRLHGLDVAHAPSFPSDDRFLAR